MLISRNEALEQLREIRAVHHKDPATAHALAVSVLLDIVDDEHVRFAFKMAIGFAEPLDHMTKLAEAQAEAFATDDKESLDSIPKNLSVQSTSPLRSDRIDSNESPFMEREQRLLGVDGRRRLTRRSITSCKRQVLNAKTSHAVKDAMLRIRDTEHPS